MTVKQQNKNMEKNKILFWAFIDAVATFIYVAGVALILFNGENLFGEVKSFAGPVLILMLLILSATITGSLVLGRPIYLFLNGFKLEAIKLLLLTALFLLLIILAILITILV